MPNEEKLAICSTCEEFSVPWDWIGQAMMQEHIKEHHPLVHRLAGDDPKLVRYAHTVLPQRPESPLNLWGL